MPKHKIALNIVTEGDPIHVDIHKVRRALAEVGLDLAACHLDWALPSEWRAAVEDGMCRPRGRHTPQALADSEHFVEWSKARGSFVRYSGASGMMGEGEVIE